MFRIGCGDKILANHHAEGGTKMNAGRKEKEKTLVSVLARQGFHNLFFVLFFSQVVLPCSVEEVS